MILHELLIVFAVAGVVVYTFHRLKIPSVVGLLASGVLVGPHALALVGDSVEVHLLAEIGVVVLLFAVGLEFSLARIVAMGRLMLTVGLPQVLVSISLTVIATAALVSSLNTAVFIGMLVAMSSTAVVIKLLADKGEVGSPHGRVTVAVLLLQDLLVIAFVLVVPLLSSEPTAGHSLWFSLLLGLAVVAGILVTGRFLLPRILYLVMRTRNRELFLIVLFLACIGTAALTEAVGLSLALGSFLAGLTLSESEYGHQTLAEVLPFRDTLASLFFISVGMLLNIGFVLTHLLEVMAAVIVLLGIKLLSVLLPCALFRVPFRTAVLTALALAQVGEFSFVLANSGMKAKILSTELYQTFLAAAVLTMALTPFILAIGPALVERLTQSPFWSRWLRLDPPGASEPPAEHLHDHVIIAGYGFNGRNLAAALRDLQIPYVILETNPVTVRHRKRLGESIEYGDCTRPAVLAHAGMARATVFVVVISDPASARRAVHIARQINPNVCVVVRTRYQTEINELLNLGANHVVPEEFETSVEVFSRVLAEMKVAGGLIRRLIEGIRADHYEAFRGSDFARIPLTLPDDVRAAIFTEACTLETGAPAIHQTIGQMHLRSRTGASVIAVRRGKELITNPGADFYFKVGDAVVLLGDPSQVEKAARVLTQQAHSQAP